MITKLDQLVDSENRNLDPSICEGLDYDEISQLVNERVYTTLRKYCFEPLEKLIGESILYMAVSVQERYKNTLVDLVQLTFDNVKNHFSKKAMEFAQKVNPSLKIDGSIEVGRSKYWASLASSANFLGKTLPQCLDELHTDIVAIWNFNDPSMNLQSQEFKILMSNMVNDISPGLFGKAPGAFRMRKTLMLFMAYTVDFTLVMQHIFILVRGEDLATSRRMIKLAYMAYNNSDLKSKAHIMIKDHAKNTNPIARGARDTTIDKIVEIISLFRIDSADLYGQQVQSGGFRVSEQDEPW